MVEYNYTRIFDSNTNLYNIDHVGETVRFSDEIKIDIPNKILNRVYCNGTTLIITFTTALTAGEKTILDDLVANH